MKIKWSEGRWFPILIKGGAMGIVNGMPVYVAGVSYPWRESELAWCYDQNKGDWLSISPLPLGRCYTAGATAGDGLIIIGGRKSTSGGPVSLNDAWLLQHIDAQWKKLPELHKGRADGAIAVVGNTAICAGGGQWERLKGGAFTANDITNAESLDLQNPDEGWQNLGDMPFPPRVGCSGVAVGKDFYLIGGYNCWVDENKDRHFRYFDQVLKYGKGLWKEADPLPVKLSGHKSVTYKDRYIISMGGVVRFSLQGQELIYQNIKVDQRKILQGEYSDLVWLYDTQTGIHELLADRMPHGLNDLRTCIQGNRIYVIGGENCDVTTSNTTNFFMIGEIEE